MSRSQKRPGPASIGVLLLVALSCTLTSDPFNPQQVDALTPQPALPELTTPVEPAEPLTPAGPEDEASAEGCSSSSELPGCSLPRDPAPMTAMTPASPMTPAPECESNQDCASLHCEGGSCQPATCEDGIANQAEGGTDCGGPCPARCAEGDPCRASSDCADNLFCPEPALRCTPVSCQDDVRNGNEVGQDCGGSCPGCPVGTPCTANADCVTGVCGANGACATPRCDDDVLNQNETGVDCGGGCGPCTPGSACGVNVDCNSGVCSARGCGAGVARCCQPPRCDDGVRNGTEPVTDCGNNQCGSCETGSPCTQNAQCQTGLCQQGTCRVQPCQDGVLNGEETGVDCGGPDPLCARCELGDSCSGDDDCRIGGCEDSVCADCDDGARNGRETDIDCGGVCGPCATGQACALDGECQSGLCEDERCCGGTGVDCTRCARRIAEAIACGTNGGAAAPTCDAFLQCLADNSAVCPVRLAPGCSEAGGVCDVARFGGNGSPGVTLADGILGTAQCAFTE